MIISNEIIKGRTDKTMKLDDFQAMVFGEVDEEFEPDPNVTYYVNANEVAQEIYEGTKDLPNFKFFTTDGKAPSFIDAEVEDWREHDHLEGLGDTSIEIADEVAMRTVSNLLDVDVNEDEGAAGKKDAKIFVFGSSKGGTGKTFTAILSAYRYAKTHPTERIAILDYDIIDGQVGISVHQKNPTMRKYLNEYQKGYNDFESMHNFAVKAESFPRNVDFYLAPPNGQIIDNDDFWLNILKNCKENYDVVVIDTGIDYLNLAPISYAYKIADKVILISTTSIKSVNSVLKQVSKLTGQTENPVFQAKDGIASRLNIVITQMVASNKMNNEIYSKLNAAANVIATFGVITDSISKAEYYQEWDVFDKNIAINKALDNIMK